MRVLILLFVSMWATGAFAQSLGDVARREAERRKTVKAPGKVYTNDVLKTEPLPSRRGRTQGAGGGAPRAHGASRLPAQTPSRAQAPAAGRRHRIGAPRRQREQGCGHACRRPASPLGAQLFAKRFRPHQRAVR